MSTAPRLATDELPAECEVVVVGSGFGAAVTAARLAPHVAPGQLVVLERGRERVPGEFPEHFSDVRASLRSRRNPDGLFDLALGRSIDSLVSSGLGGGSLIYANVMLEPRPEIFQRSWPESIDAETMRPWFDRVRGVLRPECWSGESFAKALPLAALAEARGTTPRRVPVAINLTRPAGPNDHGVVQPQCTKCGNCVTGCNVGAKTTLWASYLPLAARAGARLITRTEVRQIAPSDRPGRRWMVRGIRHRVSPRRVVRQAFEVHCDMLVLGAGSFGSTGILLRSASRELPFSARLGDHFSGNADSLAVAYNSATRQSGFGAADQHHPAPAPGPTITEMVDSRTPEGGHLVQDAVVPHGIAELLRRLLGARFALSGDEKVWCDIRAGGCPPGCGALEHSQVWLAMGVDDARGRISVDRRGRTRVVWNQVGHQEVFADQARDVAVLSSDTDATHIANPRHALAGRGLPSYTPITVHPLGGAAMADSVDDGACDPFGRVYRADGGVHAGLYVADGSLCPSSTGSNPALTIAALAERNVAHLIQVDLPRLRAGA